MTATRRKKPQRKRKSTPHISLVRRPTRQAQKEAAKRKKGRHRTAHQPEGSHTERCRPSPKNRGIPQN